MGSMTVIAESCLENPGLGKESCLEKEFCLEKEAELFCDRFGSVSDGEGRLGALGEKEIPSFISIHNLSVKWYHSCVLMKSL